MRAWREAHRERREELSLESWEEGSKEVGRTVSVMTRLGS